MGEHASKIGKKLEGFGEVLLLTWDGQSLLVIKK